MMCLYIVVHFIDWVMKTVTWIDMLNRVEMMVCAGEFHICSTLGWKLYP